MFMIVVDFRIFCSLWHAQKTFLLLIW